MCVCVLTSRVLFSERWMGLNFFISLNKVGVCEKKVSEFIWIRVFFLKLLDPPRSRSFIKLFSEVPLLLRRRKKKSTKAKLYELLLLFSHC